MAVALSLCQRACKEYSLFYKGVLAIILQTKDTIAAETLEGGGGAKYCLLLEGGGRNKTQLRSTALK